MGTQDSSKTWDTLTQRAEDRVTTWLQAQPPRDHASPDLLDGARSENDGLGFARRLLELVAASEDAFISALGLRRLSQDLPESLSKRDRFTLRAGGVAALGLPWAVIPLAKRWLKGRIAHLVCVAKLPIEAKRAADVQDLQEALRGVSEQGARAAIELDGNAVLGPRALAREGARLRALTALPEVHVLHLDPARLVTGSTWASDENVDSLTQEFADLAEIAAKNDTVLMLDARRYEDARPAVSAFLRALAEPGMEQVRVGVTLAAEIPESEALLNRLLVRANQRKRADLPPIEIRITDRSTVTEETVCSLQTGLPIPVLPSRQEREAALLRLAARALRQPGVRTVLACDSPYLAAAVAELAERSPHEPSLTVEVRSGVAEELLRSLVSHDVDTRVSVPVVSPEEFGAIVPRLVALAAEAADPNSALSHQHMLDTEFLASPEIRYNELEHLRNVVEQAKEPAVPPHRTQDRAREWDPSERDSALFYRSPEAPNQHDTGGLTAAVLRLSRNEDTGEIELNSEAEPRTIPVVSESGFANEPATDPTRPENREWLTRQLELAAKLRSDAAPADDDRSASAQSAKLGQPAQSGQFTQPEPAPSATENGEIDHVLSEAEQAAQHWNALPNHTRSRLLRRIALTTVAARDRFIQAFAATAGSPAETVDFSVNRLVDSGRYLAQLAEELDSVRGATFVPQRISLVAAQNPGFTADILQSALAIMAAGSTVIVAAPTSLEPALRVTKEEWIASGLPRSVFQYVLTDDVLGTAQQLTAFSTVERAITFTPRDFAEQLLRARPSLQVESYFSGVGTALITPSADFETAITDFVRSAFTGPDTALRGVHALLLLGTAGRSGRLKAQLADAVRGLHPGDTVTHDADVTKQREREREARAAAEHLDPESIFGGPADAASSADTADSADSAGAIGTARVEAAGLFESDDADSAAAAQTAPGEADVDVASEATEQTFPAAAENADDDLDLTIPVFGKRHPRTQSVPFEPADSTAESEDESESDNSSSLSSRHNSAEAEVDTRSDGNTGFKASRDPEPLEASAPDHTDIHGRLVGSALSLRVPPLPEPPSEAGLRALTELAPGESWLVQPLQLDDEGLVWTPGVRLGVKPDAQFWRDCVGLPVVGILHVHSMSEALDVQKKLLGGAAASIHSFEPHDLLPWLDRTVAASLTVNRPTTGALIERLPSGSWGESGMGATPLLGGPHQLVTLGSWRVRQGTKSSTLHLRGLEPEVQLLIELAQDSLGYEEFDMVRRAALADALTWRTQLGLSRDTVGLGIERNILRYWPVTTHIRVAEDGSVDELLRVIMAGLLVHAPMSVSSALGLPVSMLDLLKKQGVHVTVERDEDWFESIGVSGPTVAGVSAERVRLIGGDRTRAAEWIGGLGRISLWAEPVTMAGPVELLSFLREQSISISASRYGMSSLPVGLEDWLGKLRR
jgi:acyl-CoA reductase-like NAD-dependent aldehyde dehydrogenase